MDTETKTCKLCKEVLAKTEFHKQGKYYSSYCKSCNAKRIRVWHENNKERDAENYRRWESENKERSIYTDKLYRKSHHKEHAEACAIWRNEHRDTQREYRKANRVKRQQYDMARRARKFGVPYENFDRQSVFERDRGICHICGLSVEPELWELDHIIPLVRGGKHILENVAVSHRFCNRSKGAKLFSEMLIIPARYRKEI